MELGLQRLSLLLLLTVASSSALQRHFSRGGWAELNERFHREAQKDKDDGNWLPYQERYWNQPLDNFDPSNTVTWPQRYQYMEAYWNGTTDSPVVFLFIGGEGPIYSSWVNYAPVQYIQWAKHFASSATAGHYRSYPGSLAAWFRSKYPELTVGSVASSAPLAQKLNFNGKMCFKTRL
uniref:Serine carboxypeptidase S28 n=1 Tax=Steinernema glaseri TaxID=37863 RepID=A0A1I8AEE7_9BILA